MKWVTCDICHEKLDRKSRVKIKCKKWEDNRRGVMHIDLCKTCMETVIALMQAKMIDAKVEARIRKDIESLQ